ncbi:hypothetical protein FB45DRAFT_934431 [Roridomyces roridus]|uniref:Protein kinase domain-containing protein n=1 Tax=Roridomyces roridus TaxID=1738132 RepID=A0AAD7BCC9_9AGAR|nr:hypothetical protein FB45DRAFT_934431 [Roridomyces roridus]
MDIPSSGDDPATQTGCQISRQGAPIFHQAQNFEVSGGTFTSITNIQHVAPSHPDFRMIPLGDIDLRDLIDGPREVYRRLHKTGCVRRIYSARVDGRDSPMTVALYTGEDAKEAWSHEISRYSNLRHPNLMQIYAAAASNGICATIFHDEPISLDRRFETCGRHQPFWRLYLYRCVDVWEAAKRQCYPQGVKSMESRCWIRSSGGRLCIEFKIESDGPADYLAIANTLPDHAIWANVCCFEPHPESVILSAFSLEKDDHWWGSLVANYPVVRIPAASTVYLGRVVDRTSQADVWFNIEVAQMSSQAVSDSKIDWTGGFVPEYTKMQNGWTRAATCDIETIDITVHDTVYLQLEHNCWWMNQANYIFNRHQITSEHQRYVYLESVVFKLRFDRDPHDGPRGYLFLCPATDFQVGPWEFRWPRCPAYWSVDETGEERLSEEDACHLGFPAISCTTEMHGVSWRSSAYVAMASLQRSKGFDPYTQDVARHLKEPLFQLVPSHLQQLACVDDEISDKIELKGDEGSDEREVAEVDQLPISCEARRQWTEITQFGL